MDTLDPLPTGQHAIYALIDPTDEKVYYVGQTCNPQRWLEQHLGARHHGGEKGDWLRCLRQKGQQPLMQILEVVIGEEAALDKEREWIRHFLEKRMPLLNGEIHRGQNKSRPSSIPVAAVCRFQTIIAGAPPIVAVQMPDGRLGATLRSLCALLAIDKGRQVARIKRNSGLSAALVLIVVDTPGGPQQTDVFVSWAIHIWASGLQTSRLPEEKQAAASVLKQDAFAAIEKAFAQLEDDITTPHPSRPSFTSQSGWQEGHSFINHM